MIDSIKSLIGVDLDDINPGLVDLAESFVNNTSLSDQDISRAEYSPKEVVSFIDFELSLSQGKSSNAKQISDDLSHVADKKHIIEFLIELFMSLDFYINIIICVVPGIQIMQYLLV